MSAGGNDVRVNGLELGFADAAAVTARAREAAWADALAAAEQLASLAGCRLGKVLSVVQEPAHSAPVPVSRMQRAAAVDPLTIETGSSSVSASVEVAWELLDDDGGPRTR